MTANTDWAEPQQAEDMAYFRADLCLYSSESYSLEEKRDICNGVNIHRLSRWLYVPQLSLRMLLMRQAAGRVD